MGTNEQMTLEEKAEAIFNCDKSILNYTVSSAGSIGGGKLGEKKLKIKKGTSKLFRLGSE